MGKIVKNQERINDLKKHVFYELLDMAGRVMVLVNYSPSVVIGNRGFVGDEKETGIILVFNPGMKFTWDEYGLAANLVFGSAPQKCFIPTASISAVYSPDLNVQFVVSHQEHRESEEPEKGRGVPSRKNGLGNEGMNVISVDFVHKKKLEKG